MINLLKLTFFDVGLGNSTLIETNTMNILFDLGCDEKTGFNPLTSFNGNLNFLIISHPHKDHINSILKIDEKKPNFLSRNRRIPLNLINELIENAQTDVDKKIYKKYLEIDSEYCGEIPEENTPQNPSLNGGLILKIYAPIKENVCDLNYYSLSVYIEYERIKMLLMGDNTKSNIEELLNNSDFMKNTKDIDLLLAPHHGRISSYKKELIEHLNPRITIISDKSNQDGTTAADNYSSHSQGMIIFKNGEYVNRKCLTTRNDGKINVKIYDKKMHIEC